MRTLSRPGTPTPSAAQLSPSHPGMASGCGELGVSSGSAIRPLRAFIRIRPRDDQGASRSLGEACIDVELLTVIARLDQLLPCSCGLAFSAK
jgi:hypothetical protein